MQAPRRALALSSGRAHPDRAPPPAAALPLRRSARTCGRPAHVHHSRVGGGGEKQLGVRCWAVGGVCVRDRARPCFPKLQRPHTTSAAALPCCTSPAAAAPTSPAQPALPAKHPYANPSPAAQQQPRPTWQPSNSSAQRRAASCGPALDGSQLRPAGSSCPPAAPSSRGRPARSGRLPAPAAAPAGRPGPPAPQCAAAPRLLSSGTGGTAAAQRPQQEERHRRQPELWGRCVFEEETRTQRAERQRISGG